MAKSEMPGGLEYEYMKKRAQKEKEKEKKRAEKERRRNAKVERWQVEEAKRLFLDEAFTSVAEARKENIPLDSEKYERICKNAEHLTRSAESCEKMIENDYKYSLSFMEFAAGLFMDAAVFGAAFLLKHPIPPAALKFRKH